MNHGRFHYLFVRKSTIMNYSCTQIVIAAALILFCASCSNSASSGNDKADTHAKSDSAKVKVQADSIQNENPGDFADYYVVIADTGMKYQPLLKKMVNLSLFYSLNIDTMNRHYNFEKDLIALADDDPDELYAGEYYPRRYPSTTLSLEYLQYFQNKTREKTIALVTGIYEKESSADSALKLIQAKEPHGYKMKSHIYVGCMH